MWTREDNGEDIDWQGANEYAKNLELGGYTDWRLPTIEELKAPYDPEGGGYNIREPFRLTGEWVWSSTRDGWGRARNFSFLKGEGDVSYPEISGGLRALCVCRSGD